VISASDLIQININLYYRTIFNTTNNQVFQFHLELISTFSRITLLFSLPFICDKNYICVGVSESSTCDR
jgi:hypothetical protein